jgi:hypothetical protein
MTFGFVTNGRKLVVVTSLLFVVFVDYICISICCMFCTLSLVLIPTKR